MTASANRQPTLFEKKTTDTPSDDQRLVLCALGEFQARGKVLAERDLPLDRLRGALRRAVETFGDIADDLNDERAVAALDALGARIRRVPTFVAKHPFRITVPTALAERALRFYEESNTEDTVAKRAL